MLIVKGVCGMKNLINMEDMINQLRQKRKIFVSEADLQLELAWIIKNAYPDAKVRLEYCPVFEPNMHIDILVIMNNKWIPIELKYKTKGCCKQVDDEVFNLKNHSAKDVNCYLYLKDIQRIERIKENVSEFSESYTVFLTNDLSYTKHPMKADCIYKDFSLENGAVKTGRLDWSAKASAGTKKNCEKPIELKGEYPVQWKEYAKIDETDTGMLVYVTNQIH